MTTAQPTHSPETGKLTPISIALAVSVLVVIVLFWDAIGNLWTRWSGQQELSHSYFIPLISGWLVWTNREAVIASIGKPSLIGLGIITAGGLLMLLGQLTFIYVLQHLAIVVVIAGMVAAFGGLSLLRITAAPIAFLLFAVPPPFWVITVLSWKFQLISSVIGVWMIELMNIPVFLSGNVIDLGEYKLQVAEACSGLRYLFPFISLGVIAAYLHRGAIWQKVAIVAATFPITILMNSFRIAMTGALVQAYGTEHAEGVLHFFEGWVVFLLCLAALFGVIVVINKFSKNQFKGMDSLGAPDLNAIPQTTGKITAPKVAAAAVAITIALLGVSRFASPDTLIIPERTVFAGIPNDFAEWRHEVRPIDPTVAEVLGADDTLVANFFSETEPSFNLYVAYLEAQRDGRSWHSPRQCIPGGGWEIASHDILERTTTSGDAMNYNRLLIENRDQKQLVYYWYDQRGRHIANEFTMKFWLLVDAVTRRRSDGALVRIIVPVDRAKGVAAADADLQTIMKKLDTVLPSYIPE